MSGGVIETILINLKFIFMHNEYEYNQQEPIHKFAELLQPKPTQLNLTQLHVVKVQQGSSIASLSVLKKNEIDS